MGTDKHYGEWLIWCGRRQAKTAKDADTNQREIESAQALREKERVCGRTAEPCAEPNVACPLAHDLLVDCAWTGRY